MEDGKILNEKTVRGEIRKIANKEKFIKDPLRVLQKFTDTKMFQLGVELKCQLQDLHV